MNNKEFKNYFFNTSFALVENFISRTVFIILSIIVARYLGPTKLGSINYVESYIALFTMLYILGLPSIVMRDVIQREKERHIIIGTAFILRMTGALIGILLINIINLFQKNTAVVNWMIFILSFTFFFHSLEVIDEYFLSVVKTKYSVYARLIAVIVQVVYVIIIISFKASLFWFILQNVIFIFVKYSLAIFYYTHYENIFKWKFNFKEAKYLLKNSYPLILTGLFFSIYTEIDQVMIKELLGEYHVGIYGAAVKLSRSWYFVFATICATLYHALVKAKQFSEELYFKRLQQLYDFLFWLSLTASLFVMFFSGFIINMIYGAKFVGAKTVLSIHIWGGIFVALINVRERWIITENLQKYFILFNLFGGVLNIVLNYLMIPIWGVDGAAYATIISFFCLALIIPVFFKNTRISCYQMLNTLNIVRIIGSYFIPILKKK